VDSRELIHVFHTGAGTNVLVGLVVDGDDHLAMAREIQRDHIKGRFTHVDFLVVSRDQVISVSVPVRLIGESVGVKAGGVLEHHLWEVQVECLPTNVPEAIEADVTELEIGMSLKVSDLSAPEGVTITSNPDDSVVAAQQPQARVELEEEAAAEAAEGEAAEGEAAEGEAAAEGAEGADESSEG
jgi:large subunit ribosomal protein L25